MDRHQGKCQSYESQTSWKLEVAIHESPQATLAFAIDASRRLTNGMEIKPIPLIPGNRYTLYGCSDSAMTTRQEITAIRVLPVPEFRPAFVGATRGRHRLGTFKIPRKRGEFHLEVNAAGTLIIPQWNTGILADHEAHNSFAMSATMNLAAPPEAIRELVGENINPNFSQFDRIIAYPEPLIQMEGEQGILVFPDTETTHAVILRMRENLNRAGA